MVFLFGIGDQVSVIAHERFLTQGERARATLVLEVLPEPEQRDGFFAVRYIDPETKQFSYIYRENPVEQPVEAA